MVSINASASVSYLETMSDLFEAQISFSETITAFAHSMFNVVDRATADNTVDLVKLCVGFAVFMGFATFANLLMASSRTTYYRELASQALAIKARFMVLISV